MIVLLKEKNVKSFRSYLTINRSANFSSTLANYQCIVSTQVVTVDDVRMPLYVTVSLMFPPS